MGWVGGRRVGCGKPTAPATHQNTHPRICRIGETSAVASVFLKIHLGKLKQEDRCKGGCRGACHESYPKLVRLGRGVTSRCVEVSIVKRGLLSARYTI